MVVKNGTIYLIEDGNWGRRPVLALGNVGHDYIKVIPFSSNLKNPNALILTTQIDGIGRKVALLMDKVFELPNSKIVAQIGSVSATDLHKINTILKHGVSHNILETPIKATIEEKYLKEISEYIIDTNKKVTTLASTKTFIINIIVSIFSSLIASIAFHIIVNR